MKLSIDHDILRVDNVQFCHVRLGNGRDALQPGEHQVTTTYSHKFGQDLPNAFGFGWLGVSEECDLILCGIRGGVKPVPGHGYLVRLLSLLEAAEDRGQTTTLVIE